MKIKILILLLLFISNLNCIPDEGTFGYSAVTIGIDEVPLDSLGFLLFNNKLNELPLKFKMLQYADGTRRNHWSNTDLESYFGNDLFLHMVISYNGREIQMPIDTFNPMHEHTIMYMGVISTIDTAHHDIAIPLNGIDPELPYTVFFNIDTNSTLRE